jgi:hypothetical protein
MPLVSRLTRKIALPQCYLLAKQSKIRNCLIGYQGRVVILSIVNKLSLYYERKAFLKKIYDMIYLTAIG